MNKYLLMLSLLLVFSMEGFSQDQIILQNGQVIKGKVLSSQPGLITYQPEGTDTVLVMNKNMITAILYENGFSDIMSKSRSKGKNLMLNPYPENRFSMDWLSFAGREVSFQYERVIGNGNIALRAPFGFVFNTSEFNYILNANRSYWDADDIYIPNQYMVINEETGRGFRTGLTLVAYLNDARKVRAYLAPGFVTGYFSTKTNYDIVTLNPNTGEEVNRVNKTASDRAVFLGTDVMIGFNYLATSNLSMAFETGGGFGTFVPEMENRSTSGIWRASLLIGYNWPKK